MRLGALVLAALVALPLRGVARGAGLRRLEGSLPQAVAGMERAGFAPADLRLEHITVVFGLRDRRGLEAVIAAQRDRRSSRFHQWLDAGEITERFGPRRADYERVRGWLVERGLEVVRDSPLRATLAVSGTVGQVEATLATRIGLFRQAGRLHHAPLAEPAVPETLADSVRGILGLDDLPTFHPLVQLTPPDGPTALAPQDFACAYGMVPLQPAPDGPTPPPACANGDVPLQGGGVTGAGQSIAVLARSNFADSDIAAFSARFLPGRPPLAPMRIFTRDGDPDILPDQREQMEVLLDTQWAGALAPDAQLNVVIAVPRTKGGTDIPGALETAVVERLADVISISFGTCELDTKHKRLVAELFDGFYAIATAQGQTVVVASGDSGATDCQHSARVAVNVLASSPHAVAVGGTSFPLDADGTVPVTPAETTWDDDFGASGGGQSALLALPRYQLAAGLGSLGTGRLLPDVALAASPQTPGYFIYQNGQPQIVGGTSAGSPAFAGMLALVNQRLAETGGIGGGLGDLVPELYRLGNEQAQGRRSPVFRDIVTGDNGQFGAGPGFDLATGWGAPLADALAAALAGPGRCEPAIDAVQPEKGCLVPSRRDARGCAGEWLIEQDDFALRRGLPGVRQICQDGDPRCDTDGTADGSCTFRLALCLNVFDFRIVNKHGPRKGLPRCRPGRVRRLALLAPGRRDDDPVRAANRAALQDALAALPLPTGLVNTCTATVPVTVAVGDTLRLRARVRGTLGDAVPRVVLACSAP